VFAPPENGQHDPMASALGALAILLPVVAVAALSLVASRDLEARVHIYKELVAFLSDHVKRIERADSEHKNPLILASTLPDSMLTGFSTTWPPTNSTPDSSASRSIS